MMSRSFLMLSIMSFLTLVIYSILIAFKVINSIVYLKFVILSVSLLFTVLSIGLFLYKNELHRVLLFLSVVVLISPFLILLFSVVFDDSYISYWKILVSGTVVQIGTGIYAVFGGFKKKVGSNKLRGVALINYLLFIVLAIVWLLELESTFHAILSIVIGVIVSVLSLSLVLLQKTVKNF